MCGFCSEAWIDVGGVGGGVDLVAPWVKWFRRSGFVLSPIWVLCGFYLLGSDGLDVAVIWWFFFFFFLSLGFWFRWDLVGSGHGGVVGMVVVVR